MKGEGKRSSIIVRYLRTRAVQGPWRIAGCSEPGFAGAVVIPALAEGDHLFATLASLAANPAEHLARILVLVVVNHREDASAADKEDNRLTLKRLVSVAAGVAPLKLAWIDAASTGLELPARGGGVGLARKIGLDLALARLSGDGTDPLLISLDADTLVQHDYLDAILRHFHSDVKGGAVIPFRHRPGATAAEQAAIDRYELFIRHYVMGLDIASSPYAFHTVGSAMACSASAYVRSGGMNSRSAGEDFYFLQQLQRTSGVSRLCGTVVHPSPRPSHRVPFGTGRSVARTLAEGVTAVSFYRPECFDLLGQWLALADHCAEADGAMLLTKAASLSPSLAAYLAAIDFVPVWERLRRNNRTPMTFKKAFHDWFDAFKTLKLIHHLAAGPLPRCEPEEALPGLLHRAGAGQATGMSAQLRILRHVQNVPTENDPLRGGKTHRNDRRDAACTLDSRVLPGNGI